MTLTGIPISEDECIGDSLEVINSAFITLSSTFVVSYSCERNGIGAIGQLLAYGNGASAHRGLQMPFSGELFVAALQAHNLNGTIAIDPYLNGVSQTSYRLTFSGTGNNGGQRIVYSEPLAFNAGDTLGWIQAQVPSTGVFNVNYLVRYFAQN